MNPRKSVCSALLAFAVLTTICASSRAAGLFRTYLASDGSDSNPCTLAAPCRLLPAALAAVTDGGEIWMLDSANYNAATVDITKSVTILAVPGAVGSVVSIVDNAINASVPGTHLVLRNLRIVGFPGGSGFRGIQVNGAASLTVEDSVVSGHPFDGILVLTQARVQITHCTLRGNGSSGLEIQGGATAIISNSRFLANGSGGVVVRGNASSLTTSASISDSVLSANSSGLAVIGTALLSVAYASITRSTISHNSVVGISVSAPLFNSFASATVGANMVTRNATGLSQSGAGSATLESLGDNIVRQNQVPTAGTISTVSPL